MGMSISGPPWNVAITGPGLVYQDRATGALVGVDQRAPKAGKFLNARQVAQWRAVPPTPYAAAEFSALSPYVQEQITAMGERAAWEAMTETERAQITHPSVVSLPFPWNGYRHWMAFTPYPKANAQFENPCICASHDLKTWVTPAGVQNPLFPSPPTSDYSSDTCLYYDRGGNQMVMLWRDRGASNRLLVSVSIDGATWSQPVTIWTGVVAAGRDMASPSIWRDDSAGVWRIVGHNVDGGATWPFWGMSSSDLLTGWPDVPTDLNMPHPVSGRRWWHSHFIQLASGEIVGAVQDNNETVGAPGFIYLARSDNGVDFDVRLVSGTVGNLYRPSIALGVDDVDLTLVYSRITDPDFAFYSCDLEDVQPREADRRALLDALVSSAGSDGLGYALLSDNFNRADASAGANPVGTSSGGQLWVNVSATDTVGILGNAATNVTTGNCRAIFNVGRTSYSVLVSLANTTLADFVILRWQDANNFVRLQLADAPPKLQEVVGGVVTSIALLSNLSITPGAVMLIDVKPSRIRAWVDGVMYLDHATSRHSTQTNVGIQMSAATGAPKINSIAVLPR